jgi:cell division protein FtsW
LAGRQEAVRTALVATVAALLGIGAMMIYSTTARGDGPLLSSVFVKQMVYVAFGLACAFAVGRVDYRIIVRNRGPVLLATLFLLVIVLIPHIGHLANGARRWLRIGPLGFQPSEVAKLALVIFLAGFLSGSGRGADDFGKVFLPAAAVTAAVCILVLFEPDIGTCLILGCVAATVLFLAGARITHLFGPVLVAVPLLALIVSRGYARNRIEAWIDPWKDPGETGYHIIQSLIAVGSGGLTGLGLGASKQKLLFLPEAQTDFIFAVLAEETGLVGVTLVLALYLAFILCGIHIARRARDKAGTLLAAGITSLVAIQAVTNIAVVTKVFPTKGLALPFISAGGSSVVVMLVGAAILYNIASVSGEPQPAPPVA